MGVEGGEFGHEAGEEALGLYGRDVLVVVVGVVWGRARVSKEGFDRGCRRGVGDVQADADDGVVGRARVLAVY